MPCSGETGSRMLLARVMFSALGDSQSKQPAACQQGMSKEQMQEQLCRPECASVRE